MGEVPIVRLYPNPARNEVIVYFEKPITGGNLRLYNSIGNRILAQRMAKGSLQQRIDVSKLPAGVYQLQVQTASLLETFKLIKQ